MNNKNNYNYGYQQNPYQQPVRQNNYPNYEPPKPPKKNITAIVLGVCLGVIAIALIIAVIIVSGVKSSGDANNSITEDYSQEYTDTSNISTTTTTTTEKVNTLTALEEKLDNSIWHLYYRHNNDTFEFDTEAKTVHYTSYAPKYEDEEYSTTYECVDENTIEFTIEAYNEKYIITNYDDDSKVYVEIVLEDGSNMEGHADYLSNDENEAIELFSEYYNSENY